MRHPTNRRMDAGIEIPIITYLTVRVFACFLWRVSKVIDLSSFDSFILCSSLRLSSLSCLYCTTIQLRKKPKTNPPMWEKLSRNGKMTPITKDSPRITVIVVSTTHGITKYEHSISRNTKMYATIPNMQEPGPTYTNRR